MAGGKTGRPTIHRERRELAPDQEAAHLEYTQLREENRLLRDTVAYLEAQLAGVRRLVNETLERVR